MNITAQGIDSMYANYQCTPGSGGRHSLASPEPEGSATKPEPEGSGYTEPEPEGSTSEPEPEGSTAEPEPEGSITEPEPEGEGSGAGQRKLTVLNNM